MWAFANQNCSSFVTVFGADHCDDDAYSGTDADGNTVSAQEACCACGGGSPAPAPEPELEPLTGCTDEGGETLCGLIAAGVLSCDTDFCPTCSEAHKCDKTCGVRDCSIEEPEGKPAASAAGVGSFDASKAVVIASVAAVALVAVGAVIHRSRRGRKQQHVRIPDDASHTSTTLRRTVQAQLAQGATEADEEDCERTVLTAAV